MILDGGDRMVTKADGDYAFYNLPMYHDYKIDAVKNSGALEGVTTIDLVLIQNHILGKNRFTQPYQYLAADANNDKKISALDIIEIKRLLLGQIDHFTHYTSWRFVDPNQTFIDEQSPWPFVEYLKVDFLSSDMVDNTLLGIKVGDVNGQLESNAFVSSSQSRSIQQTSIFADDHLFEKGDIVELEIRKPNLEHITAIQFNLDLDGLRYIGSNSESIKVGAENIFILKDGDLNFIHFGDLAGSNEALFTLRFEAQRNGRLSRSAKMTSSNLKSLVYDQHGVEYALDLNFDISNIPEEIPYLLQNEPNPFKDQTEITFYLPNSGKAELVFYDISGRVLYSHSKDYEKGNHSVAISKEQIEISGMIIYQLSFEDISLRKKMILID